MHDAWLTSLLCRPPKILGRRLLPFSLAHSFILERAGNGYWGGGEKTPAHFFECVDICSRDWSGNAERFGGKFSAWNFRRWVARHVRKLSPAHVESLESYIADYAETPERKGGESGRAMVSPWQFRVVGWLVANGHTEDRAWNMPLNLALCYFHASREFEGDESLQEKLPEWQEQAYELIAIANKLSADGRKEDADKLYAYAQAEFNAHNGAQKAVMELTK
jgi:hypothetical protein